MDKPGLAAPMRTLACQARPAMLSLRSVVRGWHDLKRRDDLSHYGSLVRRWRGDDHGVRHLGLVGEVFRSVGHTPSFWLSAPVDGCGRKSASILRLVASISSAIARPLPHAACGGLVRRDFDLVGQYLHLISFTANGQRVPKPKSSEVSARPAQRIWPCAPRRASRVVWQWSPPRWFRRWVHA